MKNKMKKALAFLASMTMVATVSSVLPYSNPAAIVASADENDSVTVGTLTTEIEQWNDISSKLQLLTVSKNKKLSEDLTTLLSEANRAVTTAEDKLKEEKEALEEVLSGGFEIHTVYNKYRIAEIGYNVGDKYWDEETEKEVTATKATGDFAPLVDGENKPDGASEEELANLKYLSLADLNSKIRKLEYEYTRAEDSKKPSIKQDLDNANAEKARRDAGIQKLKDELEQLKSDFDENTYIELGKEFVNASGIAVDESDEGAISKIKYLEGLFTKQAENVKNAEAKLSNANKNVKTITTAKETAEYNEKLAAEAEKTGVLGVALSVDKDDAHMVLNVYVTAKTITNSDGSVSYEDPGTVTVSGATKVTRTVKEGDKDKVIDTIKTVGGKKCVVYTKDITPKEYDTPVTISNDGLPMTITAENYMTAAESYFEDNKINELVKAMNAYCKAAKQYLNDNVNESKYDALTANDTANDDTYAGSSIIITDDSFVTVRNYFKQEDGRFVSQTLSKYQLGTLNSKNVYKHTTKGQKTVADYIKKLTGDAKIVGDALIKYDEKAAAYVNNADSNSQGGEETSN